MLAFAFYLLKVTICSGILFGYYWFTLRNKVFHLYNRFYLLAAVVLALIFPLIRINIWHNAAQPAPQTIRILQVVGSSNEYLDKIITNPQNAITKEQVLFLFYSTTCLIFLCLFLHALLRIYRLFTRHRHSSFQNIYVVNTTARGTPFSFLKYIFWNDHIDPKSPTGNQVFRHELAHVQQKHSYDKLFMNIVLIGCWCNPFFWLIRKELTMIHEFLADKMAVEDNDTVAFAAMILQAAYPQHRFPLTNTFFYSPIKRRLMMLTKNKQSKASYIGRLLALPLAVFIFAAFTLKTKTFNTGNHAVYTGKHITVVIDAGHGGQDQGATGMSGTILEKDLNLAIAKNIRSFNTNDKIKIILTRETDLFQSPQQKAAFTKAKHADLFISIHLGGSVNDAISGMRAMVAKDNVGNATASKILASALINEFSNKYPLPVEPFPQQGGPGIRVLQDAECAAVLVEAANLSNKKDLQYLQSTEGIETIARKVLTAVEVYASSKNIEATNAGTTITSQDILPANTDTVPATVQEDEKPLVILNGKKTSYKELEKIAPENIQSIEVLKDETAVSLYEAKAKAGVLIITTRKPATKPNQAKAMIRKLDTSRVIEKKANGVKVRHEGDRPLYVIDGKEQDNNFVPESLIPDNIESITVLSDKMATDKYGEKGIHGVIEVKTKTKPAIKETTIKSGPKVPVNRAV